METYGILGDVYNRLCRVCNSCLPFHLLRRLQRSPHHHSYPHPLPSEQFVTCTENVLVDATVLTYQSE